MPAIPITLFCNEQVQSKHFDSVMPIQHPRFNLMDKVLLMNSSPYENTLFLDTDTYVCDSFEELFTLLDKFDLALAHSTYRAVYRVNGIPDSFPEFNTGVMLFKKSPQIKQLFADWLALYERDVGKEQQWLTPFGIVTKVDSNLNDQPAFREAVYNSRVRVANLTSEYNCRFESPGFVHNTVKILHGRHPNPRMIANTINADRSRRTHIMKWGTLKVACGHDGRRNHFDLVKWSLHYRGLWATVALIAQRLRDRFRKP
ncbi:hypothetical protein W02_26610 [Nitrospira sp. KM1]|nr:hypothetical protein W02_26610 [Nitrospira sp. KM1]